MSKTVLELTPAEVIAEIRRLAAEKPSHKATCLYVQLDGEDKLTGCCIVGHALINLGVDPEALVYEDEHMPAVDQMFRNHTLGTRAELGWLWTVQDRQDNGSCWADAVFMADDEHPSIRRAAQR